VDDIVGIDDKGQDRTVKVGYEYDYAIQVVEHGMAAVAIEPMAFGCRAEANWLAPRPHGRLPQDNEKGWTGGLPILVPRFRGTWPSDPCKSLKKDGPSARRSVIGPHAAS
jgi:hypothetical protein